MNIDVSKNHLKIQLVKYIFHKDFNIIIRPPKMLYFKFNPSLSLNKNSAEGLSNLLFYSCLITIIMIIIFFYEI